MSSTVLEAGPAAIRQLSGGETTFVERELATAALNGIDDPVTLVDDRPVCVDELWRTVLRSTGCQDRLILVHPSWWSTIRVERVTAAARTVVDQVVPRPRSWLLAQATPAGAPQPAVLVEIAEAIVVVTGAAVAAEPRRGEPQAVAEAVIGAIGTMSSGSDAAVLIDAPGGIGGARALAAMIADRLRIGGGRTVVCIDDARLRRLATAAVSDDDEFEGVLGDSPRRRHRALLLLALLIAAAIWAISANPFTRPGTPAPVAMATTFLVEGHVAVEVPAQWGTQRVVAGPGSARVQVTSPSDRQVALHITQSAVADQTLAGAAEALKRAIDAEPPGVFVDFNPSDSSAGRPAVTYREVRAGHDIRWSIVLDGALRIGIGCQSRSGDDQAVHDACELAVRSARAVG